MDESQPFLWPLCPACQLRRLTRCPACHVASDDFAVGDLQPEAAEPIRLEAVGSDPELVARQAATFWLICDTCDEPFHPEFYRLCPQCGHNFGEGIEIPVEDAEPDQWNDRALYVLAMLIAISFGLIGYFAWILR